MNAIKSKEAQPILKRNQHYFKIVTLYVMDKFNFNLQRQQKARQFQRFQNNQQSFHSNQNQTQTQQQMQSQQQQQQPKNEVSQGQNTIGQVQTQQNTMNPLSNIAMSNNSSSYQKQGTVDIENLSQYSGSNLFINEELKEVQRYEQHQIIQNRIVGIQVVRSKRSSSNPIKQIPSHYNHGERNYKKCIVCESKQKQPQNKHATKDQTLLALGQTASGQSQLKGDTKQSIDEQISKRKNNDLTKQDSFKQTFSTHSNTLGGKNKVSAQLQSKANVSQFTGFATTHLQDSLVNSLYPQPAPSIDLSESGLQLMNAHPPSLNKNQSIKKQYQNQIKEPISPTKRDLEMEEFQKRRISLEDFIQGTPSLKMTFSKHVRKFNRELLKATCQVIGCKPINANQIAEGVFDEINLILNNLSQSIDFEMHFDIKTETVPIEIQNENDPENTNRQSQKGVRYQQITTITTSAPLFKYVLSKHLEKYKYSRPEYLKDFYIACDLVQSKRNILVLLAGTSGTGKSTLASLLGSRLGISTVLSTDTIRHVMRNFVSKEENPVLFASTYETSAFAPQEMTSEKKRTLYGYKDQCDRVQAELEKVIEDYQQRNESLVVEGVHLTVRFMVQMMKKYPSCIPFVLCIKNEEKHKERFAVRTKHMTIDPRFNKYIKNVKSIRIIQKYLIKKAEESLIPRIDNSNVDKSIGLIHVTIVRCLRQIAEGAQIFDSQRKQATIMHHEYNLISKNQLSSRDAQQIIKQKVNKHEILELYMQKTNPEIEDKLKKYKRGQSMGELKKKYRKAPGEPGLEDASTTNKDDDDYDESPRAKSIHIIMRPDEEEEKGRKITELERKNMKKQFMNTFNDFPEDEGGFEDSQAAKLAAQSQKVSTKPKKDKKDKVIDTEEQKIRDQKKRQSDHQRKVEEEKIQSAINEAKKKEKEEQDQIEAEQIKQQIEKEIHEQERVEKEKHDQERQQQIESMLNQINPKSQSMTLPNTGSKQKQKMKTPSRSPIQSRDRDLSLGLGLDESEDVRIDMKRIPSQQSSPVPINIVNIKDQIKLEELHQQQQISNETQKVLRFKLQPNDKEEKISPVNEQSDKIQIQKDKSKKVKFTMETKSMTSLDHLKQMDSIDEAASKISSDDTSQDQQVQESKSVGRAPQNDKKYQKQTSQFKKEREREDFKSVEPDNKLLVDLSYTHKMSNLDDSNLKPQNSPDKNNIALIDSKAQLQQSLTSRHRLGIGSRKGTKSKKKTALRSLNIFSQYSFGASSSQTPANKGSLIQTSILNFQSQGQTSTTQQNQDQDTTQIQTQIQGKVKHLIPENIHHDDTQSQYSGNSGLAPSLVSHTINYFPQGGRTEDDNQSVMQEQLHESGGSSENTDSMHVEDSFHDAISEEVSYSQSTDSEHEEEHIDDVIQQKEASFNHNAQAAADAQTKQQELGLIKSQSSFNQNHNSGSPNQTFVNGGIDSAQKSVVSENNNNNLQNIMATQFMVDDPMFFQYEEGGDFQIQNNSNTNQLFNQKLVDTKPIPDLQLQQNNDIKSQQ